MSLYSLAIELLFCYHAAGVVLIENSDWDYHGGTVRRNDQKSA
jgi:hypothetical protein